MSRLILPACAAWLLSAPAMGDASQPDIGPGRPPAIAAAAEIPRCTPDDAADLRVRESPQPSARPATWAPATSALLIALFVAWRKLKA